MDTAILALILFASITWALVLGVGGIVGIWLLWRHRSLRRWVADFDRGLEREERIRAYWKRRYGA